MPRFPATLRGRAYVGHRPPVAVDPVGTLLVRVPHLSAESAAREILSIYPRRLLVALAQTGTRIWLLQPGETVAAVPLLGRATGELRWLDDSVRPDDCAGLTVPLPTGPLVIAPWQRPAVLRHEIGHALAALLTERDISRLVEAFERASRAGRWLVPLAAHSPGEYLACGAACFALPGGRDRVLSFDSDLGRLLAQLWQRSGSGTAGHAAEPGAGAGAWVPPVALGCQRLGSRPA